ncbi:MAG: phosphatidate cytidylyltransferase [Rhodocyclales bacterium]|nr:phosphatidate cytidylyltransferase [Rhodocyclales bacterium]
MLKTRIMTACGLATALLLLMFFLPDWAWGLSVAVVVWLATGEWSRLIGASTVGRHVFGVLAAAPIIAWSFTRSDPILLGAAYVAALALWAFSVPVFLRFNLRLEGVYARFGYGLLIFIPAALALIELRRGSPLLLLACLLPIWIADIAAFFVGRKWGRTKLAPTISPGKSREGVAGAVVAVALYAFVLFLCAPAIAGRVGLPVLLGLSLVFTCLSVFGDLFESLLKRHAGVKDSGDLLPGHGGILDRVDSLLATLPLAGMLWLIYQ